MAIRFRVERTVRGHNREVVATYRAGQVVTGLPPRSEDHFVRRDQAEYVEVEVDPEPEPIEAEPLVAEPPGPELAYESMRREDLVALVEQYNVQLPPGYVRKDELIAALREADVWQP